jgi:DNA-binding NarL/FixJ family response regulator
MSTQVEMNGTTDHHPLPFDDHSSNAAPGRHEAGNILLIESRPLMGEMFCHAVKEAASDLDVRILHSLEDPMPAAALAVFSFVQRNSDPLFISFVVQQLRARLGDLPLLIITENADPATARLVDEAGLRGWTSASMGFDAMIAALRAALAARMPPRESTPLASGDARAPLQVAPRQFRASAPAHNLRSEIHLSLTDREIDVLTLLRKGKQNKVIAHALNISESTAKVHIRNIMRKFHLRNRTEVALMCGGAARQQGDADMVLAGPDRDYETRQLAMLDAV